MTVDLVEVGVTHGDIVHECGVGASLSGRLRRQRATAAARHV
jgi:hypothetical protein